MKDFKGLAHADWQFKYHIVRCPKYRSRIFKGENGPLITNRQITTS
ncbi:MAG: hypothetical protein ABIN18_21245 [Pseudomonadota bacterium]